MYTASSSSRSSMACLSIMLKRMLSRVGAKTQLCFTPSTKKKCLEKSMCNLIWPCWSSCMIILWNFGQQPKSFMISPRPFLLTVSNALVKSTKVTYSAILFLELPEKKKPYMWYPSWLRSHTEFLGSGLL